MTYSPSKVRFDAGLGQDKTSPASPLKSHCCIIRRAITMRRLGTAALPVRLRVCTGAVTLRCARGFSYTATATQQQQQEVPRRLQPGYQTRHTILNTSALSHAAAQGQTRDHTTTAPPPPLPPLSNLSPNDQKKKKKTAQDDVDDDGGVPSSSPCWSPLDEPHSSSTVTQRIEAARRLRALRGRLVAPTASYSDSDMFKHPVCVCQPLFLVGGIGAEEGFESASVFMRSLKKKRKRKD